MKSVLAIDIGGTSTRYGKFSPTLGRIGGIQVHPTPNRTAFPGQSIKKIQGKIWSSLSEYLTTRVDAGVCAIGVSFAGPVNSKGEIVGAPTIWGSGSAPFPLAEKVEKLTGLPCYLINDVSAAAWRFSRIVANPFSIITISSGVGNKVFYGDSVLVNEHGYGGELGHSPASGFDGKFQCDCGGWNHVGAISSGRGTMKLLIHMARNEPSRFGKSILHKTCRGKVEEMTPETFVSAVRCGDSFASSVLGKSVAPIAFSMANLYAMTGIDRHIIIGGFANALGTHYKKALLDAMRVLPFYGRKGSLSSMVKISKSGDSDCLIGSATYSYRRLSRG